MAEGPRPPCAAPGPGCGLEQRWHIMGVVVSDTTIDTRMADHDDGELAEKPPRCRP